MRPAGLEPATLGLEGRCSIQMSYGRIYMVGVERFELPTSCSQSRRATRLRYTPNTRFYSSNNTVLVSDRFSAKNNTHSKASRQ